MHVLLVAHGYPPASVGGVETYVHDLAGALAAGGDRVTVLAREANRDCPEGRVRTEFQGAVAVHLVNNTFRDCTSLEDSYRHPRLLAALMPLLDALAPDVVHVHHLTCLSTDVVDYCRRNGRPVVMTLHDYWLMCHRGQLFDRDGGVCVSGVTGTCDRCLDPVATAAAAVPGVVVRAVRASPVVRRAVAALAGRLTARLPAASREPEVVRRTRHMRQVAAGVSRFLAPSADLAGRFVTWGLPPSRIELHGYGIVSHRPGRRPVRTVGPLRAGFVGSLLPSKAPHLLLEAAAALGPSVVTVDLAGAALSYHGDGRYLERLRPMLAGPGVRHRGVLAAAGVRTLLAHLDVLVVPSVWPENSPLVIREAFDAGLPVVASRIGGIPELVADGVDGVLVPPGDVPALASVLGRLHADRDWLSRLAAAVRPPLAIELDAARTRRIYGDVLQESIGRAAVADAGTFE